VFGVNFGVEIAGLLRNDRRQEAAAIVSK